jgi:predicted transcriptional regulator
LCIDKVYDGSLKLFSQLLAERKFSKYEVKELKKIAEQYKGGTR